MAWCDLCGDVDHVCDSPECDVHQREEDVRRGLEGLERELASASLRLFEEEDLMREVLEDKGSRKADRALISVLRRQLYSLEGDVDILESEYLDLEEELGGILRARARGLVLVPRKEKDGVPEEQLRLPFD